MPTPQEAVESASSKFTRAETALNTAHDKVLDLLPDFKDVYEGGPLELDEGVQQFGFLEMSEFQAEAAMVAGLIAEAKLALVRLHIRATGRSLQLNLDPPQILGGGGR